jgi:hypothetical protein
MGHGDPLQRDLTALFGCGVGRTYPFLIEAVLLNQQPDLIALADSVENLPIQYAAKKWHFREPHKVFCK